MSDMNNIISVDDWARIFKPKSNPFSPDIHMLETYGQEWDFFKAEYAKRPNFVWTWVCEGNDDYIIAGCHFVNRMGYYITELPYITGWESAEALWNPDS